MEDRMTELELRFMQQENTIQELNDTVYRHEQSIARLEQQVIILGRQIRTITPSPVCDPDEEEPPPHY